ncbi:hypothetical protein ABJ851_003211 [Shigella flexneri]|nr:hypothetical protein [Escherichia coli]
MPTLSCNVAGIVPPFRLRRAKKMPMLSLAAPLTLNMALPHHVSVGGPLTISLMRCRPDKRSASGSFAFVISF